MWSFRRVEYVIIGQNSQHDWYREAMNFARKFRPLYLGTIPFEHGILMSPWREDEEGIGMIAKYSYRGERPACVPRDGRYFTAYSVFVATPRYLVLFSVGARAPNSADGHYSPYADTILLHFVFGTIGDDAHRPEIQAWSRSNTCWNTIWNLAWVG